MTQTALGPTGKKTASPDIPAIQLRGLTKVFGDTTAVNDVDLAIRQGEFFSMLGPSGSGKTTVLRLIAGFESPTSGTVELVGTDVTARAPFERDVNTVFQDYALFPHMSLIDNVAYGLRVRGVPKRERRDRAGAALERVQLGSFLDRKPSQLSGGQRQRVALARALVVEPRVLLLDEPLGALDLKLRQQMQVELKELQRSLGITFIFVTHDQEEALTMSDRIGVFNNGRLVQVGTAKDIYDKPNGEFVANFVGTSNIFPAAVAHKLYGRGEAFSVRPERLRLTHPSEAGTEGSTVIGGTVAALVYLGHATQVRVALTDGTTVIALVHPSALDQEDVAPGRDVAVQWRAADVVWLLPTPG
jgi:putative spermidine/putrescine transport system ATP-binding protein